MDERQLTRGISYMWNDVAGLLDETSSFFICKTMVKLPGDKPNVREIIRYEVKDLTKNLVRNSENEIILQGNICMEIIYLGEETEEEEVLLFDIPYEGVTGQVLDQMVEPRVNYINCQGVGLENILIETVLELDGVSDLSRSSKGLVEAFGQDKYIQLPDEWPGIHQLISMQVQHHLEDTQVLNEQQMQLSGVQEVRMLYIGDNPQGDKVIFHREINPFDRIIHIDAQGVDEQDIQISNQMVTAQIVDSRAIVIDGKYVVLADGQGFDPYVEEEQLQQEVLFVLQREEIEESVDLAGRFEPYLHEQEEVVEEKPEPIFTPDHSREEVNQPEPAPAIEIAAPIQPSSAMKATRPSRRERLNKHMRDLNAGVSSTRTKRPR